MIYGAADRRRDQVLILLATMLVLIPFLNQAFHIDDRIYLEIAAHILEQPLFPYDYPPLFEGLLSPDATSHSHLPLTSYYLAAVRMLTGSTSEWVYHLAFAWFPLLAVLAFYDLSGYWTRHRLGAALLLLFCPAFIVLSHTLMTDVAFLAFWLLALERFLRLAEGRGGRRDWLTLLAALSAAALISLLTAGLLILMGAVLLLPPGRPMTPSRRRALAAALLWPLVIWVCWYTRAYWHYHRLVLVNTALHMEQRQAFSGARLTEKAFSFLLHSGGILLFPPAVWFVFRGRWRTRVALLSCLLMLLPFSLFAVSWPWSSRLAGALFASTGLLVFWEWIQLLRRRRRRELILWLWFMGILASCLLLYYSGSARYLLPAAPPLILLWILGLEGRSSPNGRPRGVIAAVVLLTAFYAAPIAVSDFEFANLYRKHALRLVSLYGRSGHQVWFTAEWGFRYYLERAGARILPRVERGPQPGDILIKPVIASPWVTLYDGRPGSRLLQQRLVRPLPLQILDFTTGAGFYSSGWGPLPFAWGGRSGWERFNIYRIESEFEGPLPNSGRHW